MIIEKRLSIGHLLHRLFFFLATLLLNREAEGTMPLGFSHSPLRVRSTPAHSRGSSMLPWVSYRPPERALIGPFWMSFKASMDVTSGDSSSGSSSGISSSSAEAVEPPQQMANYIRAMGLEASFFKAGGGGTAQVVADAGSICPHFFCWPCMMHECASLLKTKLCLRVCACVFACTHISVQNTNHLAFSFWGGGQAISFSRGTTSAENDDARLHKHHRKLLRFWVLNRATSSRACYFWPGGDLFLSSPRATRE